MWNLIKNVFRSLKKNKITIIGLTFLIFLSVGIFTILQSTSTNINNTYDKVSSQGNKHDFTISESYNTGYIKFNPGNKDLSKGIGKSSDDQTVYWPDQVQSGSNWVKTYYLTLSADESGDTLIDQFYKQYEDADPSTDEYKLIYRSIEITNTNHLTYMDGTADHKSTLNHEQIINQLSSGGENSDTDLLNDELSSWSNELIEYVEQTNSPLNTYLNSDELKDKLYFRNFTSLKINNSSDGIYYDVVQSCPVDSTHEYKNIVDREILFNNSVFDNVGWNNFSQEDWKPTSNIKDINDFKSILSNTFKPWDDIKSDAQQQDIVKKQFEILSKGSMSSGDPASKFITSIKSMNDKLQSQDFSSIETQYKDFLNEGFRFKDLNDKKYAYVISYEYGSQNIPFTWLLDDWTSHFCICAPQYMQKHNLRPFDVSKMLQTDEDYQKWYSSHTDIKNDRERFISWMNSLNQQTLDNKYSQWIQSYPNNIVNVAGGAPYFILSAGITGDFVYPIVSIEKPIPNTSKECILFTNKSGYDRIQASFQGNPTEKYIVGKFKKNTNHQKIIDQINNWSSLHMSWPENVRAAYLAEDMTNTLNASAFRISYIPQLVDKVNMISYLLTAFVLVVGLIISAVVVRRYINSNRVSIGIMQANGIKKWSIALSLTPFSFIPSLIGGIGGYLIGTFLQNPTLGLFSSYWTLPTSILSFSANAFLLSVLLPFAIFTIVSLISTYIILRNKTVNLMKQGSEYKNNVLMRISKKGFSMFGVISRFRASIAFCSIWKLIILSLMSALTMSTLVFGLTLNGKFDQAINKTNSTRNYSYAIDLYTPTIQGGQYIPISEEQFGKSGFQESAWNAGKNLFPTPYYSNDVSNDTSWKDITSSTSDIKEFTKQYFDTTFSLVKLAHLGMFDPQQVFEADGYSHANLFLPYMSDAIGQKTDIQYLKNRISNKLSLNYLIGLSFMGMTSNPWDISASLMPESLKNTCNDKYETIINEVGKLVYSDNTNWNGYQDYITKYGEGDGTRYEINQSKTIDYSGMCLDQKYTKLLLQIFDSPEITSSKDDFYLDYNSIPLSNKEETYTYVSGDLISVNNSSKQSKNIKIIGIDNNTKYVNLIDNKNKSLLPLIDYKSISTSQKEFPIVVNQVDVKKYGIKNGDILTFDVSNKSDRFMTNPDKSSVKFKVVGITKSCENEEYFIDQQIANKILGLKSKFDESNTLNNYYVDYKAGNNSTLSVDNGLKTWANWNDITKLTTSDDKSLNTTPYGFNGYFTDDKNGSKALTNTECFYSPSGLWLPSSSISSNSSLDVLKYGSNLQLANVFSGMSNSTDIGKKITAKYQAWQDHRKDSDEGKKYHEEFINCADEFVSQFRNIWGDTDYVTLVTSAVDKNSNIMVYKTMSNTISSVEKVILSVIFLMVFFIVLLMSSMIISDCKRLAAILSSLGYTDWENALSFMSIYIPMIIFGLLISIPLTMGLTVIFQNAVLGGIGLLLNASIQWYYFAIAGSFIAVLLIISIVFGFISLKRTPLIDMIK